MRMSRFFREFLKVFSGVFWGAWILDLCDGLPNFTVSVIQMFFFIGYYWCLERLFDLVERVVAV